MRASLELRRHSLAHSFTSRDKMKVAVGLSGGVDSSMTAHLLKEHGHDVIGLTMKIWDGSLSMPDEGRAGCYGPGESRDLDAAKDICARLGIEHHVIDLSKEYKEEVLLYFRNEYLAGRTPNPCTRCNRTMKLGSLIDKAREQGLVFERFSTGHYARVHYDAARRRYILSKGIDGRKDQSYFLSLVNQEQLSRLMLPLGEKTKDAVRELAREAGFGDLADKAESQDFIESKNYSVLFAEDEVKPGTIVDERGNVLGEHSGIINFTIGQRKGLCGGAKEPQYVLGIDPDSAVVRVGGRKGLESKQFRVTGLNLISLNQLPPQGLRAVVKIRQQHKGAAASVFPERGSESSALVEFDEPQIAITPGQTAAFYDGDEVAGAGIIDVTLGQ